MGISTVAVFSDPDAHAPFVREADVAVRLPGSAPRDTYLRRDLVIAAAQATGADAVHPGYGFLAENAEFARDCAAAGLVFVGPPADAIEAMGDKLRSKELMQQQGVPVLTGIEVTNADVGVLAAAVRDIGLPLIVKASAGGGGQGIRIVRTSDALADAVAAARREAGAAFGNDTVFLERYVDSPRHIEVQIFADGQGNVVSLFERECSVQRRFQKIVEESPSTVVDAALRARLGEAAVAAARGVGYRGAGTVEFVLARDGTFAFLEMNTRLQVEHPVTEEVTGLDLVRLQLIVAEGHPIPDEALAPTITGHAIEVRLYAEDVRQGFLPTTGTVGRFFADQVPGLRVDSSVETGTVVGSHYDPMLAKVICHAATRSEAARRLAGALRRIHIDGVVTNRDLLVRILENGEFLAGRTDTHFLECTKLAEIGGCLIPDGAVNAYALAAAFAAQALRRRTTRVLAAIPSGWRNNRSALQQALYEVDGRTVTVGYDLAGVTIVAEIDGVRLDSVILHACEETAVDLEIGGVRRRYDVSMSERSVNVHSPLGSLTLVEIERFAPTEAPIASGSLRAPMPGLVQRVLVEVGQVVEAGSPLVVLEAMKMEHTVNSPRRGLVVQLPVTAGDQVAAGAVLAVIETHEDDAGPKSAG
jgi:propionyl-CoA carboxylase alpha chain